MGPGAPHHLVLIDRILAHIDFLEQSIAQVQDELWLAHPAGLPVQRRGDDPLCGN
jgi:hypothetical protein